MEFGKGFGIKCNCGAASCTGVIGKFFKTKDEKTENSGESESI